jgi:hypothetical protein
MRSNHLINFESIRFAFSLSFVLVLLILGSIHLMEVFMYDSLVIWNKMQPRANSLQVLTIASLAFHQLEFIRHAFHLISQTTVILVIHRGVPYCFDETVVVQKKEDAILNRPYFVIGSFFDDEVKI